MIKRFGVLRFIIVLMLLAIIIAIAAYSINVWRLSREQEDSPAIGGPPPQVAEVEPEPAPPPPEPEPPAEEAPEQIKPEEDWVANLPHDKLFITPERQQYQDSQLTLIIPKLDKVLPIYKGVSEADLKKGVGLYDCSQLPGRGNRNVSVAGHRNTSRGGVITDKAPFYYIDTLGEGDYLYLADAEYVYRYLYEDTTVVEANDWGPIYSQGFSCLTITSCTPIGVGSHRIVVRGRLDEIFPFSDDFNYLPQIEEVMDNVQTND